MTPTLQDALARLATDASLRARFERDRSTVSATFGLDEEERATLLALDRAAFERFAQGLLAKRWGEVARVVPLTVRLAPALGAMYRRWLARHPAAMRPGSVLGPGLAEAERALGPLAEALRTDPELPPWTHEIFAWEVLSACARHDGVPRSVELRWPVDVIAAELRAGLVPRLRSPAVRARTWTFGGAPP